jgi:hypothetical protein
MPAVANSPPLSGNISLRAVHGERLLDDKAELGVQSRHLMDGIDDESIWL